MPLTAIASPHLFRRFALPVHEGTGDVWLSTQGFTGQARKKPCEELQSEPPFSVTSDGDQDLGMPNGDDKNLSPLCGSAVKESFQPCSQLLLIKRLTPQTASTPQPSALNSSICLASLHIPTEFRLRVICGVLGSNPSAPNSLVDDVAVTVERPWRTTATT